MAFFFDDDEMMWEWLNVGIHTSQTIVSCFIFALTCTTYLFVYSMELLFLRFLFVCFPTVFPSSTLFIFTPTLSHYRSLRCSSAFLSHCYVYRNGFLSFAPNVSEWLWWTFMHLKLYKNQIEKNGRRKNKKEKNETMPALVKLWQTEYQFNQPIKTKTR